MTVIVYVFYDRMLLFRWKRRIKLTAKNQQRQQDLTISNSNLMDSSTTVNLDKL